jgi:hypothetical protein
MQRRLLIGMLCLTLVTPAMLVAEGESGTSTARNTERALQQPNPPASAPQDQQPSSVRPNATPQQRSYEREVHARRRHSHISRGEVVFMGAIAGTSMGIGAIAGGGAGLAIGALVGGWGAYAGHRFWHFFNK